MQRELIEFYLEYVNDYLTVSVFAEHKGMPLEDTSALLGLGKKYTEMNAAYYKRMGYEMFLAKKGN